MLWDALHIMGMPRGCLGDASPFSSPVPFLFLSFSSPFPLLFFSFSSPFLFLFPLLFLFLSFFLSVSSHFPFLFQRYPRGIPLIREASHRIPRISRDIHTYHLKRTSRSTYAQVPPGGYFCRQVQRNQRVEGNKGHLFDGKCL